MQHKNDFTHSCELFDRYDIFDSRGNLVDSDLDKYEAGMYKDRADKYGGKYEIKKNN